MRYFATLPLAGMLLAATASAGTLIRIDRSITFVQEPIRALDPPQIESAPYASDSATGEVSLADLMGLEQESATTRVAAPLPTEPPASIDDPLEVWRSPDDPTYVCGPDFSHDKDFGFDEKYFGLEAGYGARAASIETRYESDDALLSEEDDLHVWANAEVRALGWEFTILDAEARATRSRSGDTNPMGFTGLGRSSNILRLVIKNKTKVNESNSVRAEYIYPAVKAYLIGGGATIGIGNFGVEVSAGVGAEIDLGAFAESSNAGTGYAKLGGAIDAYVFAEALGEFNVYLFKLSFGANAKLMDTAIEAPIRAQDKQIGGAVDLIVMPFSALMKMTLKALVPYKVRVKVWTWRFWEWRVELRWRWQKVASVKLFDYDMDGFEYSILDF